MSGGCCDGSAPRCRRAADLPAGPHDMQLGAVADVPVVIDGDQSEVGSGVDDPTTYRTGT